MIWDIATRPQAVDVWRLRRISGAGAVTGLHLIQPGEPGRDGPAPHAPPLDAERRALTRCLQGVAAGREGGLAESANHPAARRRGHRCLVLYGSGLLAEWCSSGTPVDAEVLLRAARERSERPEHTVPSWSEPRAAAANSVWAWDVAAGRCLVASVSGDCRLWAASSGEGGGAPLTARCSGFRAAPASAGRLVGLVHVRKTRLWAAAFARTIMLCSESGPITTVTAEPALCGAPFAEKVAPYVTRGGGPVKPKRGEWVPKSVRPRSAGSMSSRSSVR